MSLYYLFFVPLFVRFPCGFGRAYYYYAHALDLSHVTLTDNKILST